MDHPVHKVDTSSDHVGGRHVGSVALDVGQIGVVAAERRMVDLESVDWASVAVVVASASAVERLHSVVVVAAVQRIAYLGASACYAMVDERMTDTWPIADRYHPERLDAG